MESACQRRRPGVSGLASPLVATRVEADVVVATGSTAQEHAVRVEGGGGERGGLVALEET